MLIPVSCSQLSLFGVVNQLAQKELQKINTYKAPRDKLVCILNCCRVINNLLLNVSIASKDNPPGADDFLPVLIYVVIKVSSPTTCLFPFLFSRPSELEKLIDNNLMKWI